VKWRAALQRPVLTWPGFGELHRSACIAIFLRYALSEAGAEVPMVHVEALDSPRALRRVVACCGQMSEGSEHNGYDMPNRGKRKEARMITPFRQNSRISRPPDPSLP
jgi:hypothetical protein